MDNKILVAAAAIGGAYWFLHGRKRRNPMAARRNVTKPTKIEVEQLIEYRRGMGSNLAKRRTDIPQAWDEIRRLEAREARIASTYPERNATPARRAEYARRVRPIRAMVEQLEEKIHQEKLRRFGITDG